VQPLQPWRPLTPPSLSAGGGGSGLAIGGLVTARGGEQPNRKSSYFTCSKPAAAEVTLNNYLTLASHGSGWNVQVPEGYAARQIRPVCEG
jgi:hypothetical protein